MNKIMIYTSIILMFLPMVSLAIQSQEKDIYLDTGGATGRLIYTEQYYSKNITNSLILEESRTYFDGTINNSKITFLIIRPLDKQGNRYEENQIRALATLDNKTILNTWYTSKSKVLSSQTSDNKTDRFIGILVIITVFLVFLFLLRLTMKKMRKTE